MNIQRRFGLAPDSFFLGIAGAVAKLAWLAVPFLLLCMAGPVAATGNGPAGPQPAKIAISVVPGTGAPGGRDACLAEAMKAELSARGANLRNHHSAAYTVKADADWTPSARRPDWYKHIVIRWTIVAPDGKALPKAIVTGHDVAASDLEASWCRQAAFLANAAAYSVLDAARGISQPEAGSEPSQREAALLFEQVWKDKGEPQKCELDIVWFYAAVPEELASEWLDAYLHADLVKDDPQVNYQKGLGLDGKLDDAFCGAEKFENYRAGLDRNTSAKAGWPWRWLTGGVHRSEYSFPIFDRNFSRAVIMVRQYYYRVGSAHELDFRDAAYLYLKQDGKWAEQSDRALRNGHGVWK